MPEQWHAKNGKLEALLQSENHRYVHGQNHTQLFETKGGCT